MNRIITAPDAFNTIVWGGFAAGVLDATDAVAAYGILGMNPIQVLQYVASGLLGHSALPGGTFGGVANAGLGAVLHFLIAFTVAAVYYAAARKMPVLIRQSVVSGLAFGATVYLFMTFLVLPCSAVAKSPFSVGLFLNGIFGHALFVGLPVALFAKRPGRQNVADRISGQPAGVEVDMDGGVGIKSGFWGIGGEPLGLPDLRKIQQSAGAEERSTEGGLT